MKINAAPGDRVHCPVAVQNGHDQWAVCGAVELRSAAPAVIFAVPGAATPRHRTQLQSQSGSRGKQRGHTLVFIHPVQTFSVIYEIFT